MRGLSAGLCWACATRDSKPGTVPLSAAPKTSNAGTNDKRTMRIRRVMVEQAQRQQDTASPGTAGVIVAVETVSLRRSALLGIVTALTSWVWSGTARAYRPFDETDADVAETHDIELELGPIGYLHQPTGGTFVPGFILNYGVVARVELVFDAHAAFLWGGPDVAARRRQLDSELSAKVVVREGVLQDRPGPSVA